MTPTEKFKSAAARQQARAQGLTTYVGTKPCRHNHPPIRLTSNGTCLECSHIGGRKHREKYREEYIKEYHANPEQHRERLKKWRKANPEKVKAQRKRTHTTILVSGARARAKSKGLEFSITAKDISIPKTCPVLGIPIITHIGKFNPNAPSIDRIDSTKGYTKENIQIISWRANRIKNDATIEELTAVIKYLEGMPE